MKININVDHNGHTFHQKTKEFSQLSAHKRSMPTCSILTDCLICKHVAFFLLRIGLRGDQMTCLEVHGKTCFSRLTILQ